MGWKDAPVVSDAKTAQSWQQAPVVGESLTNDVAVSNKPTVSRTERFLKGVRDPIDASAQLLANVLPQGVENAINQANNYLADKTGLVSRLPQGGLNQQLSEQEAEYQARRGDTGLDAYRLAGNVLSPTNIAIAAKIPVGATAAQKALSAIGGGAAINVASQPVTEPNADFATEKTKQAAIGAVGGGVGGALGNYVSGKVGERVARNALLKQQNAPFDETVSAAQQAGFTIPRSLYNPSTASNLMETFGGKAATLQAASAKNQEVVNNLTRKALDLPESAPLSISTIEKVRTQAYKPYQEIAKLPKLDSNDLANYGYMSKNIKSPAQVLNELKQARADTSAWFNAYNRSASPDDLAKARNFQAIADDAEKTLEGFAKKADRPELLNELKQARKTIAKTYTAERAINKATGNVDPRVLARLYEKGKPLSDGFDEIGRFASAFPKAAQPSQQSAGAGISALDPVAGAMYGGMGSLATGSPAGLLAAGIPLLRSPARSIALSKAMQKTPQYGGNILNTLNRASPALPYLGTATGGLLANSY